MTQPLLEKNAAEKKQKLIQALLRKRALQGPRFPLSFPQERLWFLHQLEPQGTQYNMPMAVRISGALDLEAFTTALHTVLKRHESLRTLIAEDQGTPFQVILPFLEHPLPVTDLSAEKEAIGEAKAMTFLQAEAQKPFDLRQGPYLRFGLLKLKENDYWFYITQHHIITDGWSLGVFMQELTTAYKTALLAMPPQLPELAIQYPDFSKWQRGWLQQNNYAEMCTFWKNLLATSNHLLNLPLDHPRPAAMDAKGHHVRQVLSQDTLRGLKTFGLAHRASLFMVILSTFGWLLRCYCLEKTVRIGTTVAGRNRSELEHLIGFFVNTLVLPVSTNPHGTVAEHLEQTRALTLAAFAHQDFPFEALVKELQPERHANHPALCQVMFSLQNAPLGSLELPGLVLKPMQTSLETVRFDLSLNAIERVDGLSLSLQYPTSLFHENTVENMLDQLCHLLRILPQHANTPLKNLPRPCKRLAWLRGSDYALANASVSEWFDRVARETPDAIALISEDQYLSYAALANRLDHLAAKLITKGVVPEQTVGVLLPRGLDLVAAMLGIFKAGATFLPLDTDLPEKRLAFMLKDSHCQWVWVDETTKPTLANLAVKPLMLPVPQKPLTMALPLPQPHAAAYVIYTSGSSGLPKGVVVTHAGLASFCLSTGTEKNIHHHSRILQFASFNFDVSLSQLLPGLLGGASVYLRGASLLAPHQFWQLLCSQKISHCHLTPAYFQECLQYLPRDFSLNSHALKRVDVGGDSFPKSCLERWTEDSFGQTELFNSYGPTESIITASTCLVTPAIHKDVPLGMPLPGRVFHITDPQGALCSKGMPGELLIGGDPLARCYLGAPRLTAKRFIPDSQASVPGARCYRSGDLVRLDHHGVLQFLGRIDHQIKIRGYRIETGEIVSQLEGVPGVLQAAVFKYTSANRMGLAAFVQPEVSPETLRRALETHLPEYMVPQYIVSMPSLPLTLNGKIDHQALLKTLQANRSEDIRTEAYHSPMEEMIAHCFAKVLQIARPTRTADFFKLGGHSLLGLRLIAEIAESTGVHLALAALFTHPSPAKLALLAANQQKGMQLPAIEPHPIQHSAPLSLPQRRLWFLEQFMPGTSLYNIPMAIHLKGPLGPTWFEQSLALVVETYPELLTQIKEHPDGPRQQVCPTADLPLTWVNLTEVPNPLAQAGHMLLEDSQRPFNFQSGLLLRMAMFQLRQDHHVFYLNLHHLLGDGWSLQLFMQTFAKCYRQFSKQQKPQPQTPPCNYFDYAWWQQKHLQGPYLEKQRAYWKQQFSPLPAALPLPLDKPRPQILTHHGDSLPFAFDQATCQQAMAFSKASGLTLFMTILAIFKVLLWRYSNQTDLVVGTPISNRHHSQTHSMFGLFANTLALRSDLVRNGQLKSFEQLTDDLKQTVLEAHAHQDIPLEQMIAHLNLERDTSRSPLFQVMFTLTHQDKPSGSLCIPHVNLEPYGMKVTQAKFELTLSLAVHGSDMVASFEYNTDLFSKQTIETMARHFLQLSQALLKEPQKPLSHMDMLGEEERHHLLTLDGPKNPPHATPFFNERFSQRVRHQPDAVALRHGNQSITYTVLNQRAHGTAQILCDNGIGPEQVVAVCMPRSEAWLAAMIGVLKSGAIYLPIDPQVLLARRNFMLKDAGACLLVTHGGMDDLPPELPTLDLAKVTFENDDTFVGDGPVLTAEQGAYLIYTSGTTGHPKAVCISLGAMQNHHQNMLQRYQLTSSDKILQLCAASFDISLEETLPTFIAGGCLVLVAKTQELDLKTFLDLIARESITVVNAPTALWHAWVEAMATTRHAFPTSLRLQIVGTEAANPRLLQQWRQHLDHPVTWINAYGPTEATVTATTYRASCEHATPGISSIPIGRPLAGVRTYVLNKALQPMPKNATGWLYIGGKQLARGYWHKPRQTAAGFLPDPFSHAPGARMYATGDLCLWQSTSGDTVPQLMFAGRQDHQVKIRGHRIEIEEIHAHLGQAPHVLQNLVIVYGEGNQKTLIAYVTLADSQSSEQAQTTLSKYLQTRLPSYMVPSQFMVLKNFPLNASGKIDRARLPDPLSNMAASKQTPRVPVEETICQIFSQVLEKKVWDTHADFFKLGGHSLLAIKLLAILEKELGLQMPLVALFQNATVAHLAELMEKPSHAHQLLVPLNQIQPEKPPLILVHPIGGHLLCYRELVAQAAFPHVWGIQASGLEPKETPMTDLDEMASAYAKRLRQTIPGGPYHLAGWSMGGVLALKLAALLSPVSGVFMLDSYAPQNMSDSLLEAQLLYRELKTFMPHTEITTKDLEAIAPAERNHWVLEQAVSADPNLDMSMLERIMNVFMGNQQALTTGFSAAYDGRVFLMQADQPATDQNAQKSWGSLLPNLETASYSGGHFDWFNTKNLTNIIKAMHAFFADEVR